MAVFTPIAMADFEDRVNYIAQDNRIAVKAVRRDILDTLTSLRQSCSLVPLTNVGFQTAECPAPLSALTPSLSEVMS